VNGHGEVDLCAEDEDDLDECEFDCIFETEEDLAKHLCAETARYAREFIATKGSFTLAIPGGSVAKALAGMAEVKDVDFSKVYLFFVNERCPERKNFALAQTTWTQECGVPASQIFTVGDGTPSEEAQKYADAIMDLPEDVMPSTEDDVPSFDLILLGMGEDGHVGSLYPNSSQLTSENIVEAVEREDKMSITFTPLLINSADQVIVAATGQAKAATVAQALTGEATLALPASIIMPDSGNAHWFLDEASASLLLLEEEEEGTDYQNPIRVFDDEVLLSEHLANNAADYIRETIESRGTCTLAIPGGSVAKALKGFGSRSDVDWSNVYLFFVNERCPEGKNLKLARETWTDAVQLPEANIFTVGDGTPSEEARKYEEAIMNLSEKVMPRTVEGVPSFDLILLGMGADGHVGSLYPDSEQVHSERLVESLERPDKMSITFTPRLLNSGRKVIIAATGEQKAATVERLVTQAPSAALPASLVVPTFGESEIYLDVQSGSNLMEKAEDMPES